MRHQRTAGWTLIEVMAASAITAGLLLIIAQVLGNAQRSWLSTRHAAEAAQNMDVVTLTLQRELSGVVLNSRSRFVDGSAFISMDSDLHFVCGPADELITAQEGVCGDAVFFQRPNSGGVLECSGFFVQFGNDADTRPALLGMSTPLRHSFRLMQFRQPADELVLFQPSAGTGSPPLISTLNTREALYDWFRAPLELSSNKATVLADHVVALLMQTLPEVPGSYDTRRHQWEGDTSAAVAIRHMLPKSLEITIIACDAKDWERLDSTTAAALAKQAAKLLSIHDSNVKTRRELLVRLLDQHQVKPVVGHLSTLVGAR